MENRVDILKDKELCCRFLNDLIFLWNKGDRKPKDFDSLMQNLTDEVSHRCFGNLPPISVRVNNPNDNDDFSARYFTREKVIEYSFSKLIKPVCERLGKLSSNLHLVDPLVCTVIHELTHFWVEEMNCCDKHMNVCAKVNYHCLEFLWKLRQLKVKPKTTIEKYPECKKLWNKFKRGWKPVRVSLEIWDVLCKNGASMNPASLDKFDKLVEFISYKGAKVSEVVWRKLEDYLRKELVLYFEIVRDIVQYLPFERLLSIIEDLRKRKDFNFYIKEVKRSIPINVVRECLYRMGIDAGGSYETGRSPLDEYEDCNVDGDSVYLKLLMEEDLENSDYSNLFNKLASASFTI